jgi:hypothetical protein
MIRFVVAVLVSCFLTGTAAGQSENTPAQTFQAVMNLTARTKASFYLQRTSPESIRNVQSCPDDYACFRKLVLPVSLISFSGVRLDKGTVELFWETAQETNNDFFLIERTTDPSRGYETVAKVMGSGSTSTRVTYQKKDPNSHAGYTYYRLKQVDFDSTFTYSGLIGIEGSGLSFSITAFPNPSSSGRVAFEVHGLNKAEEISIVVVNALGSVVYRDDSHKCSPENRVLKPDLSGLPVGRYMMRATRDNEFFTTSFVLDQE